MIFNAQHPCSNSLVDNNIQLLEIVIYLLYQVHTQHMVQSNIKICNKKKHQNNILKRDISDVRKSSMC